MTRQPGAACRDHGHTDPASSLSGLTSSSYRWITGPPTSNFEGVTSEEDPLPNSSPHDDLASNATVERDSRKSRAALS
jgi:hypothetical protein